MTQPMRADHGTEFRSHCLQDLVDAIAAKPPASANSTALAELEEERAWFFAAQCYPRLQTARHHRIERKPLTLSLTLSNDAQAAAPRVKVLKIERDDLAATQRPSVAKQEEDRDVARRL